MTGPEAVPGGRGGEARVSREDLPRAIIDHAEDIIYATDLDGRLIFLSRAWSNKLGHAPNDDLGRHFDDFVHPGDLSSYREVFASGLQGGETERGVHCRIRDGAGRYVWRHVSGSLVRDASGRPSFHMGVARDIRRELETAEELRQGREFLRTVFDAIGDGMCVLDRDLRVLKVNAAMRDLYGVDETDTGASCHGLLHDRDAPCPRCPALTAMETGQPQVAEEIVGGPDAPRAYLEIHAFPLFFEDDSPRGAVVFLRDLTARKRAEQALFAANRDIETLLGAISSILVCLDGRDRVKRWNSQAEQALGIESRAVLGRRLTEIGLVFEPGPVEAAMRESRRMGRPVRLEMLRVSAPDGRERLLGLTVNPVKAMGKAAPELVILARDITEIKAREIEATNEMKMQSIGRMAAGMAHEINTPIQYVGYNAGFLDEAFGDLLAVVTACRDLAEAARSRPELAEALAAPLAGLDRSIEAAELDYLLTEIPTTIANTRKGIGQVAEIVRAMKHFSHPGATEKTRFDLAALVRDAVTVSRNEWKNWAEVDIRVDPDLPLVLGLPHEISQVILNLVLNAAQAVEETSRQGGQKGRIAIDVARDGDAALVTVADTGPGIAPALRSRVFEPFFTTKEVGKGTGQGLAIARAVVVGRHKGELSFASEPGRGATFVMRLPLDGPVEAAPNKTSEGAS